MKLSIETARTLRKNSTEAEIKFWQLVRRKNLFGLKFRRQHPIEYTWDRKKSFFIADFYCFEKRLIIELDGEIHKKEVEKDYLRTEILEKLGYKVIRFKNEEIINNLEKAKEYLSLVLS